MSDAGTNRRSRSAQGSPGARRALRSMRGRVHWLSTGGSALLAACVVGGAWVWVIASVAAMPTRLAQRPVAQARPDLFQAATEAYRAGRWDRARQGFEALLRHDPLHERARDYLDRLNAIAVESERLTRAEEAMAGGRVAVAVKLAATVPPHSPLFAQAEALMRPSHKSGQTVERAGGVAAESSEVDVDSVLQQAVALYNAGRFREATARARELAAEAEGEPRRALLGWARRCERFGEVYARIPEQGMLGGDLLASATQALYWDRELGGAHSRHLRPRVVSAYRALTEDAWHRGEPEEACERWLEGRHWEPREAEWGSWPELCEDEARQRLSEGRARERGQPRRAAALYTQVTKMLPSSSALYQQARERLRQLARR